MTQPLARFTAAVLSTKKQPNITVANHIHSGYDTSMKLELIVDNTPVVPVQPFDNPIVVTRDDMKELRSGFDEWMEKQSAEDDDI